MRGMQVLLIEDEKEHRLEFKEYVSALKYPISFYVASGESDGLEFVQKFNFDFIILDLELHESDGDGMEFLKKLKQLHLAETPYIIIVSNNSSPNTRQAVRSRGADYIFWKGKRDYSPKLVMDFARDYYQCKIDVLPNEPQQTQTLSLEDDIKARIGKVGINDDMIGRQYIICAISTVVKSAKNDINLNRDVYPIIAKKYAKSVSSIIKAIEAAINKAWCITNESTLSENYPAVISGAKGAPTNKEFIFYYAHLIKDACKV